MTIEQANRINEQFHEQTNLNLDEEVSRNEQLSGINSVAFINRTEKIILEEIKSRCPKADLDNLNQRESAAIESAIIEQMTYMIVAGDFTLMSGYDPTSNGLTDINQLRKRQMSPLAIKILTNAGLFYSGVSPCRGGYFEERSYWGKSK